jgi:hypothetical protein
MLKPTTIRMGTDSESGAAIDVLPPAEPPMETACVAVAAHPGGTFAATVLLWEPPPDAGAAVVGGMADVPFFAHDAVKTAAPAKQASRIIFFIRTFSSKHITPRERMAAQAKMGYLELSR